MLVKSFLGRRQQYSFADKDIFQHGFGPGVLGTARAFLYVEHLGDLLVVVSLDGEEVKHGSVTNGQHPDAFDDLFGLDDSRDRFLPYGQVLGILYVYALAEFFILLEHIDTRMHDDLPDPPFQCPLVLKLMNLRKNPDKAFLKHILRVFPVFGKTVTNRQHFGTVAIVEFLLGCCIFVQASLQENILGHAESLIT
jgi:hypothetical protein